MKKYLLFVILLVVGCATFNSINSSKSTSLSEQPISKKIYYLQHKLIPNWVFNSMGVFFEEMKKGNDSSLIKVTIDIVNEEYAKGLIVNPDIDSNAILITFPEPKEYINCFYAIVQKCGNDFTYTTYEKTIDIGGGFIGVVGGWDNKGSHLNFGPREYKSSSEFVNDVLKNN